MLSFTHKARQAMQSYGWPGNVRELRNRVQRAAVMSSGPFIEADDMELTNMDSLLLDGSLKAVREAAERQALQRTLARFPDQLEGEARTLGISRATLYGRLQGDAARSPSSRCGTSSDTKICRNSSQRDSTWGV